MWHGDINLPSSLSATRGDGKEAEHKRWTHLPREHVGGGQKLVWGKESLRFHSDCEHKSPAPQNQRAQGLASSTGLRLIMSHLLSTLNDRLTKQELRERKPAAAAADSVLRWVHFCHPLQWKALTDLLRQ